jgi:hypothetical protein
LSKLKRSSKPIQITNLEHKIKPSLHYLKKKKKLVLKVAGSKKEEETNETKKEKALKIQL